MKHLKGSSNTLITFFIKPRQFKSEYILFKEPIDLMTSGNFQHVPYITGIETSIQTEIFFLNCRLKI